MRTSAIALLSVVLTACGGVDAAPAPTATPEADHGPWVLFQQDAGARYEVAMVHADGTGLVAPVSEVGHGHQTNPDWDPSGQHIVFVMNDGERDDLWIADADGSHPRMLLDCRGSCRWLDDPAWSPDGTRVAYSRGSERAGKGHDALETVDVRTGEVTVLREGTPLDFTAGVRWSPDGTYVVFELVHTVEQDLESDLDGVTLTVMPVDRSAGPEQSLTDPLLYAATADWSPDGTRIVYSALPTADAEAPDLFTVAPTGGTPARVTTVADHGGFAAEPTWLPDGSGLLFSGLLSGSGSPQLLAVDADGTDVRPAFPDGDVLGRHPRVQPAVTPGG
jgi:Tol biopolymer transport system component